MNKLNTIFYYGFIHLLTYIKSLVFFAFFRSGSFKAFQYDVISFSSFVPLNLSTPSCKGQGRQPQPNWFSFFSATNSVGIWTWQADCQWRHHGTWEMKQVLDIFIEYLLYFQLFIIRLDVPAWIDGATTTTSSSSASKNCMYLSLRSVFEST